MSDDALGQMDMTDLLSALGSKAVSPAELRIAAMERLDAAKDLNAVAGLVDAPAPRSGPFAGLPLLLKDNELLAGTIMTQGSAAMPQRPSRVTSDYVQDLQRLGFDVIARTTLPEFGLTATTESTLFGATRNPWNLDHSVGGSSGGSSALVAAGILPYAHANDGGGSIRIPASCCGLVGFKPSIGRHVIADVMRKMPINIESQGVVTRTVRDTALFHAEMETLHPATGLPPLGQVTSPGSRRLRIGFFTDGLGGMRAHPEVAAAVRAAAAVCEDLGHVVDEISMPFPEQFGKDFLRYWGLLSLLLDRLGGRLFGEGFDRDRLEILTVGLSEYARVQGQRVIPAIRRLRKFGRDFDGYFGPYDVLLSPVLAHEPPRIGHLGPHVPFLEHMVRLIHYTIFTPYHNVSGTPAVSLPLGTSEAGLPIGVQFAAAMGRDRTLLELSYEMESAMPWSYPTR